MIRTHALFAALALSLATTACEDPAKGKAKAEVSAAKTETAAPAAATIEKLTFDQSTSTLAFVGAKVTAKHDGGFKTFSGTIDLDPAAPEKSRLSVEIVTDSIFSDSDKLTGHLKSPDFFDVAKYPKATFVSTEIKPGGDKGATHTITGNLDLHGVKKSVSFPATIQVAPDAVTANAEFAINRKDFGIVYPGMPDDLIRDEVVIKLNVKAPRTPRS